jgi:hypothetical protein
MRPTEYTDDPCDLPDDAAFDHAPMPRKHLDDYWEVIGLDDKIKPIDPDKLGCPLPARRWRAKPALPDKPGDSHPARRWGVGGDWEYKAEYLYPVYDDPGLPPETRRIEGHILVFLPSYDPEVVPLPWEIPWPLRELDDEDTARWYMRSEYPLPDGFQPVPIHGDPTREPSSRLSREWRPQTEVSAGTGGLHGNENRNLPGAHRDPLNETLELIPRSTLGARLVQYLIQQQGRQANLRDVCKLIYKSIDTTKLHKMRKVIRETRTALEKRDAPLRLTWDNKTKIVMLISRDGT